MNRVDASRRVNTKSPEAQKPENAKWLGTVGGLRPRGNVELVWTEFECPECGKHWTAEEVREIEETARPASKVLRIVGELLCFALVFGLILFVTSRAD